MTLAHVIEFRKPGYKAYVGAQFTDNGRFLICDAQFAPVNAEPKPTDYGTVSLWNVKTGSQVKSIYRGQSSSPTGISHDGRYLLLRHGRLVNGEYSYWDILIDVRTNRVLRKIVGKDHGDGTSALSPDGRIIAVSTERGDTPILELIDAATGQVRHRIEIGAAVTVGCIAFSPDGELVAGSTQQWTHSGDPDDLIGDLYVWNARTGRAVFHKGGTWSDPLFFLGPDKLVCENGLVNLAHKPVRVVQVFNRGSQRRQNCIDPFGNLGHLVLIDHTNRSGNRLLDNYEVWDVVRKRMVKAWRSPNGHEVALSVSPDRCYLATTGDYRTPTVDSSVIHLYRIP